jgi:hypothetical protein
MELALRRGRWVGVAFLVLGALSVLVLSHPALAATKVPKSTTCSVTSYTNCGAYSSVVSAVESPVLMTALTIRDIVGPLALLVMILGAVMRTMVHNPQMQMSGTRAITIAVEVLVAVLAFPLVIGWLGGSS